MTTPDLKEMLIKAQEDQIQTYKTYQKQMIRL